MTHATANESKDKRSTLTTKEPPTSADSAQKSLLSSAVGQPAEKSRRLEFPRSVRRSQIHDPEFVRAVFTLAYRISMRMKVEPGEWPDYVLFLTNFAQELGVNAEALEKIANLDALSAPDNYTEEETEAFETHLFDFCKRKLCRQPTARRQYVRAETRAWFLTTATVLKAAFPDIIRHKPIWNAPKFWRDWKKVHSAWKEEREWLANRISADD